MKQTAALAFLIQKAFNLPD